MTSDSAAAATAATGSPSSGVERVRAALRAAGSVSEIVQFATTTRTAADAAAAIGCTVAQIAKSLVFRSVSGEPVLVIASGVNRVDEAKVAAALGEPIGKADAGFVRERTGFAIGGVAPLGHATKLRIFIDRDLLGYEQIWAAAGHPNAVFRLTPAELQRLTGGTVITVA
jgi:prolyl-tRNA editing enzyme YbaK/EbsC (Cys-tRNA(Pro) deacylase)